MNHNGPFDKVPPLAGAVDLSGPKGPPRTTRETNLRSTLIIPNVIVNEERVVQHYELRLLDQLEGQVYIYAFEQNIRANLLNSLKEMPDIGQVLREDA